MTAAPTHPDTPWSDMTPRAPRPLSSITDARTTRRQLLAMATVGGVSAAGIATAGPADAATSGATAKPRSTDGLLVWR
jgi:hypothetical protein